MRFLKEDFPRAVRALEQLHMLGRTQNPNMESIKKGRQYNLDHLGGHILAENYHEIDPDSGLHQSVHIAWRALAQLECHLIENGET